MPKYIDAEALKAAVIAYHDAVKPRSLGILADVVIHDVLGIIDEAPAADVVRVVRCKDCVCMGTGERPPWIFREDGGRCLMHGLYVLKEDFCSNGERMDDDENAGRDQEGAGVLLRKSEKKDKLL